MIELDNPTDEQEMEESLKQFEKRFKKLHSKEIRRDKFKKYSNKLAGIAAVLMLVFMAADITTKAIMDESLFHMIGKWTYHIEISPGENEASKELSSATEGEVKSFNTMDEFAEYFSEDFLICSWLPEKTELDKIISLGENEMPEFIWEYKNTEIKDWKLEVWLYQDTVDDTAGVAGEFKLDTLGKENIGQIKVIYYENNDGLLAGFKYGNWWYLVDSSSFDTDLIKSIVEGMVQYEKVE